MLTRQRGNVAAPARPVVSVCIANWNCRAVLRDCLESLLRHEQGVAFEVIVVDNGSTDGAADLVSREFPEVRLLRNADNRGFSRANNQAARAARGRYLFFLNNDTLVPPETLGQLVEAAERRPEIGVLAPRLRDGRGRIQGSWRTLPTVAALLHRTLLFRWTGLFRQAYHRYRGRRESGASTQRVDVVMGAAMLVPRPCFLDAGGWDEAFTFGGEDIDLCARIGRTRPIVYFTEAEIVHYGRVSSRQHIGYAHSQTIIGITRYLRKSGTPWAALCCYKVVLTLDAPLKWLGHMTEWAWRLLRGKKRAAARSRLAARGVGHFLRHGLWEFWRV